MIIGVRKIEEVERKIEEVERAISQVEAKISAFEEEICNCGRYFKLHYMHYIIYSGTQRSCHFIVRRP